MSYLNIEFSLVWKFLFIVIITCICMNNLRMCFFISILWRPLKFLVTATNTKQVINKQELYRSFKWNALQNFEVTTRNPRNNGLAKLMTKIKLYVNLELLRYFTEDFLKCSTLKLFFLNDMTVVTSYIYNISLYL